jgi:tetratricopeptide (TPR) repeat protein
VAERLLDYRPLPPALRTERPRRFDAQPVLGAPPTPRLRSPLAQRLTPLVALAGLLVLALAISLAVTGGGGPTIPPVQPTPTPGPFDEFESQIPEAQRSAEQNANDPRAWIAYGDTLYNSAEIVRENAPDSQLYQQRLSRWFQATLAYTQALALEPNNPATRADLGASACFYGAGIGDQQFVRDGTNEARRAAQEALDNPRVLLSLGHCLVSAQPPRTEEALANWRRVVQLAPDSPLAAQAQELIARYGR